MVVAAATAGLHGTARVAVFLVTAVVMEAPLLTLVLRAALEGTPEMGVMELPGAAVLVLAAVEAALAYPQVRLTCTQVLAGSAFLVKAITGPGAVGRTAGVVVVVAKAVLEQITPSNLTFRLTREEKPGRVEVLEGAVGIMVGTPLTVAPVAMAQSASSGPEHLVNSL
jgi:hypothetical protein